MKLLRTLWFLPGFRITYWVYTSPRLHCRYINSPWWMINVWLMVYRYRLSVKWIFYRLSVRSDSWILGGNYICKIISYNKNYMQTISKDELKIKQKEFLSELSEFFKKHWVCIQWDCNASSDTYGITWEKIIISSNYWTWDINDNGIEYRDIDDITL